MVCKCGFSPTRTEKYSFFEQHVACEVTVITYNKRMSTFNTITCIK